MNAIRVAATVGALVVFPVVLAGSVALAAIDHAAKRLAARRLPDVVDEAESWVSAIYQGELT